MANITVVRVENGRKVIDTTFDPVNIPSTDEKAALAGTSGSPSGANAFVTNNDNRVLSSDEAAGVGAAPNAITAVNPATDKTYVDAQVAAVSSGVSWLEAVDHNINYVKAGAPIGTGATNGEKMLDTSNNNLHTFTGGAWDAGTAVSTGDRFIFKDDGTDTSGDAGTHTADDDIREFNGATFDVTNPTQGAAVCVLDEGATGKKYVFNGTVWVFIESVQDHNQLGGLQGGNGSDEFHHLLADEDAALNAATTLNASNPPQTLNDRDKMPVRLKFVFFGGFAAGQTDVEVFDAEGVRQQVPMPSAGSIVKTALYSDSARTAGTLTAEPTIEGTKVTENGLDTTLDGTTTNDDVAEIAPGTANLTFTAGQKIGIMLTSDGSWANASGDIVIDVYVVFDS